MASQFPVQSCELTPQSTSTPLTITRNNTLRQKLSPLGYSDSEIREVLDDPVDILSGAIDGHDLRKEVLAGYQRGFRAVFLVGAGLAVFAFVISVLMMPQISLERKDDEQLKLQAKRDINEKKQQKREADGKKAATPAMEIEVEKL